jgi:hypothetical protein
LLWSGLTDNALRVQALAPAAADWHGQIMPVRLAALEGEQFVGECVL